jgi:hypothetical protein
VLLLIFLVHSGSISTNGCGFFLPDPLEEMAKGRRSMKRRGSRKGSRKAHRKGSRKAYRKMRGGAEGAPVNYSNPGPMEINFAQGRQFDAYHKEQHGGAMAYGPYPGAVTESSALPADLVASAKLLPLNASFDYIKQFGPEADLKGGRRRKSRKGSRKSRKSRKARKATRKGRKASRKQRGGVLVRWGGARRRYHRGGARAEMNMPMPVGEEGKMLIPPGLQAQAGLNPEWQLAKNPMSFAPLN